MIGINSIADIALLRESVDLECKLAGGRDGQGAVPDDFWSTYSAFANTQGGVVLLGVREKNGHFDVAGIQNVAKLRKALFDCLNNRQKLSVNLLNDSSAHEIELEGKTILAIEVPRATRKLAADLKVPFILKDGVRQDDTPLHRALREALINALVHSDYSDRASVLVIKRPSGFVFRNPGGLRCARRAGVTRGRKRLPQSNFAPEVFDDRSGRTGRFWFAEDSSRLGNQWRYPETV